jgi:cytoskeletal protein RodZ
MWQWRRAVRIGEALAEARRQAGLIVTQVSQRTCIRETIICGIERDDYCACGGDFYARGTSVPSPRWSRLIPGR